MSVYVQRERWLHWKPLSCYAGKECNTSWTKQGCKQQSQSLLYSRCYWFLKVLSIRRTRRRRRRHFWPLLDSSNIYQEYGSRRIKVPFQQWKVFARFDDCTSLFNDIIQQNACTGLEKHSPFKVDYILLQKGAFFSHPYAVPKLLQEFFVGNCKTNRCSFVSQSIKSNEIITQDTRGHTQSFFLSLSLLTLNTYFVHRGLYRPLQWLHQYERIRRDFPRIGEDLIWR